MIDVNEMRETAMKNLRILEEEYRVAWVDRDVAIARATAIGNAYNAARIASEAWETALAD